MKDLGKTLFELLNSELLADEVKESLTTFIENYVTTTPLTDDDLKQELDEFLGGHVYLAETLEDLYQIRSETGCDPLNESPPTTPLGFDTATYLGEGEKVAWLFLATCDAGGSSYVLGEDLLNNYPTIREHVFVANKNV